MNKYFDYPESSLLNDIIDDDNYTISFDIDDKSNINKFFHEHGFVIIKNVLSLEDCSKTERDILNIMKYDINKKSTLKRWSSIGKESEGLVSRKPIFTKQIISNQRNKKVNTIFSRLLNSNDLETSYDSCYFLRPTKFIKFENNVIKIMDEWKTKKNIYLDLDVNKCYNKLDNLLETLKNLNYLNSMNFINESYVFSLNVTPLNIEGIINITNNKDLDGGFSCLPGFHKYFNNWHKYCVDNNLFNKNKNKYIINNYSSIDKNMYKKYIFNTDDPIKNKLIKINMRAGSLCIWDQRLPYSIEPNNSNNYWIGQKIRYYQKYNLINNSRSVSEKINIKF